MVFLALLTSLAPGIDYDASGGYYTVVVDLDSDATEVRVAEPHATAAGDAETVATHAADEGATVAINANYFGGSLDYPCGLGRGFGMTFSDGYSEAVNCETSLLWARGAAALIDSFGHEHDPAFHPEYTDAVTGGGFLLVGGARHDWNHAKLEEGRDCTAIGASADRKKMILVVTDPTSCTGAGLQDALLAHGAADAIHLDGGGSSKLWIRGMGYVNGEPEDRAPSIVVIARPNGACPSDCGADQCVQLARPFRAECVGEACRAGLGSIWNCDEAHLRRARCDANGNVEKEYCASGCMTAPDGQDDQCIGGAIPEPMPDGAPPDAAMSPGGDANGAPETGAPRGGCSASGRGSSALALLVLLCSRRAARDRHRSSARRVRAQGTR